MRMRLSGLAIVLLMLLSNTLQACPRIVSQSPYLTHNLQWLGLEDCIVGVSRYDTLDRPQTGGVMDPDVEAIALLQPALVFASERTPAGTLKPLQQDGIRVFRLAGFAHMQEVEDNLGIIGRAAGIEDIDTRVQAFRRQWREAAAAVGGNGQRVLLLSACSGTPYSFGRGSWLTELFAQAGFVNAETQTGTRLIEAGKPAADINALVDRLQPELIFLFERTLQPQCKLINPKAPVRIVLLDGEQFLHPAPILLQGLNALQAQRTQWTKTVNPP